MANQFVKQFNQLNSNNLGFSITEAEDGDLSVFGFAEKEFEYLVRISPDGIDKWVTTFDSSLFTKGISLLGVSNNNIILSGVTNDGSLICNIDGTSGSGIWSKGINITSLDASEYSSLIETSVDNDIIYLEPDFGNPLLIKFDQNGTPLAFLKWIDIENDYFNSMIELEDNSILIATDNKINSTRSEIFVGKVFDDITHDYSFFLNKGNDFMVFPYLYQSTNGDIFISCSDFNLDNSEPEASILLCRLTNLGVKIWCVVISNPNSELPILGIMSPFFEQSNGNIVILASGFHSSFTPVQLSHKAALIILNSAGELISSNNIESVDFTTSLESFIQTSSGNLAFMVNNIVTQNSTISTILPVIGNIPLKNLGSCKNETNVNVTYVTDLVNINFFNPNLNSDSVEVTDFNITSSSTIFNYTSIDCETESPTNAPSISPSIAPSNSPSISPTLTPSFSPTLNPSDSPSQPPTQFPTFSPTLTPSGSPSQPPTQFPTGSPSQPPTQFPTKSPTQPPTQSPTESPTFPPTFSPTKSPTLSPTSSPTDSTENPTNAPTFSPTSGPTGSPTQPPTDAPTFAPTNPTINPTSGPTESPTQSPTNAPTINDDLNAGQITGIVIGSVAFLTLLALLIVWLIRRCYNEQILYNGAIPLKDLDLIS